MVHLRSLPPTEMYDPNLVYRAHFRRCDLSPNGAPVRGSYQLGFKLRLG